MNRIRTFSCLVTLCMLAMPLMSFGQVQQLPIQDFIDAQNSAIGWTEPATDRNLAFDHFGKRAEYFGLDVGTTFEGRVTVRTLADGRGHVSVILHTRNAVCWGAQGDFKGHYAPAFGYSPSQVSNGLGAPSLGDGMMNIEFTMPSPDAPLPKILSTPLESATVVVNCSGELRNGSGFPDGTPGRAHTTQVFFAGTGGPGSCRGGSDCIATEKIDWNPIGKK